MIYVTLKSNMCTILTTRIWHVFNSHCPLSRTTQVGQYQNVSILHFIATRMMEVVVATGAVSHAKLQSDHHHQQTNTQLFTGRMPFLSPTQQSVSKHGREKMSNSTDVVIPCSPGDFPFLSWPLKAPGYLGRWLPCLSSALYSKPSVLH